MRNIEPLMDIYSRFMNVWAWLNIYGNMSYQKSPIMRSILSTMNVNVKTLYAIVIYTH